MFRTTFSTALMVAALAGCVSSSTDADQPEDAEDGQILGADNKEDSVWFVEDNSWDSEAVLRFVNTASYDQLTNEAGLTSWPAKSIANAKKPIKTLTDLDALSWVGPVTFSELRSYAVDHGFGPKVGEEYAPANEEQAINNTMAAMSALMFKRYATTDTFKRGQHAKAHGCVDATFHVENNVPAAQRLGLFAQPGDFRAIVRYSNGDSTVKADNEKDVRGMAIKVIGVDGEKIMPEEATATTQDFLLISHPTLMVRNVLKYADLAQRMASGNQLSLVTFFLSLNPADWELHGLTTILAMVSHKVPNPLAAKYFSTTPYALGANAAVKYSAQPCVAVPESVPTNPGPDYLRDALKSSLASGDACFNFYVQPQVDARTQPIEDPTIEWKTPMVKVATLTIPQQTFDSAAQTETCENLSFTPWHSLPEHRPLGGINRARKAVYKAISGIRHMHNGAAQTEPR
ncbi:MAG TPA: hypothetical protein VGM90_25495 [Kofleriaceae bacterium]|jgi:hypothetical protein